MPIETFLTIPSPGARRAVDPAWEVEREAVSAQVLMALNRHPARGPGAMYTCWLRDSDGGLRQNVYKLF